MDFLFQESLLYTSIPLRRNVSTRISLRGLRRVIWVDRLRRVNNVGFLVEQLIYILINELLVPHCIKHFSFRFAFHLALETYKPTMNCTMVESTFGQVSTCESLDQPLIHQVLKVTSEKDV